MGVNLFQYKTLLQASPDVAERKIFEINCQKILPYREKFVPLHQDAKRTKASKLCGITMKKIFLSARENFHSITALQRN